MIRITTRLTVVTSVAAGMLVGPPLAAAAQPGPVDGKVVPDGYIVVFHPSVTNATQETGARERAKGFKARFVFGEALEGFAAELSPGQVAALRSDPEVAFVTPDRPVRALGLVSVASGESGPSGIRRLEAASSGWTREASDAGVAVIDTGVDLDHPDLNTADGRNCVTPGAPADDDNGHGTHVAGTIAARNDGAGVVGVAPGTRLHAIKVLDSAGAGSFSSIICGIDWVTSTRTDSDPSNDIAVANMSLGGLGGAVKSCSTTSDVLHKAICNSTANGVTYVVAAGNDGSDFDDSTSPFVPAAYPEVLTVTAASDSDGRPGAAGPAPSCSSANRDDRYATFSNYALTSAGRAHTIAGPGVCINSTWPGGGYRTTSGTSMATPHVAGEVALCLSEAGLSGPCASLAPAQIVQKLRTNAESHAQAEACDGFTGDPQHAIGSKYFGYLGFVGVTGGDASGVSRCQPIGFAYTGSIYNGTGQSARLFENDASRLELNPVYSGGSYVADLRPYAQISPAQRTSLKKLTVDYDGHLSSSYASLTLRVYNFATASWQNIYGPVTRFTSDRAISWSNTASPKSYVSSSGEIRVSVLGKRSSRYFRTRTDLVRLTIEH